jgi:hypothetical protein
MRRSPPCPCPSCCELYAGPFGAPSQYATVFTLTTDTPTTMATDGPNVYFINAAGELRALPIP